MKTIKKYLEDTEETLDKQFPKGKCKERGNALVLFAIFNMAMESYKKDILGLIDEWLKDKGEELDKTDIEELKERINGKEQEEKWNH